MRKNYTFVLLPLFCAFALSGCNGGNSSGTTQTAKAAITSQAEHATINFEKSVTSYNVGDTVVFTVIPQENYVVDTVTANGATLTETSGKYSFTALLENTIVVTDKLVSSTIAVNGGEHCTIEFDKSKDAYHPGEEVVFTVTPNEQTYVVNKVEANGVELEDTLRMYSFVAAKTNTITITEDYAAATVTYSGEHASFTFEKENYKCSEVVKFNVAWDSNYEKASVKVGENDVAYDADAEFKYSFTAALSNHVVAVAQGVEVEVNKSADSQYVVFDMEKTSYRYGEEVRFNVSIDGSDEIEIASVSVNGAPLLKGEGDYAFCFTAGLTNSITVATRRKTIPVSSFNITAGNSTVSFEKERYELGETAKFRVTPNNYYKVTRVEANEVEVSETEGWYMLVVSLESNSVVVITDYDPVAPTIIVEGDVTTFNELETNQSGVTLPTVSATDCYGSALTPTVTYKFNGEAATDPGYNSESAWAEGEYAVGKHEWTFTASDTHDITKVASKTVTLNVYRKLLTDGGEQGTITNPLSNNPSYTNSNAGLGFAGFYMDRSFNYYVEMAVSGVTGTDGNVGFLHTISDKQTSFNSIGTSWIYDNFGFNNQHKITINGWSDAGEGIWESTGSWQSRHLKNDSAEYKALNPTWAGNTNKIAVARIGTMFYTFLNDYLFDAMNVPAYSSVATSAGIGTNGNNNAKAVMSNFVFVEGEAATVSKVDSLLAKSPMFVGARAEMQDNIYVTTGLGEDRTNGSYANVAQTPNDDVYNYATAVRSKYLLSNAGTVIDYDFQYDLDGSIDCYWGKGFKFSTMFMDPNCTTGSIVSDFPSGQSANGFILSMDYSGLAVTGGTPSYGGESSGYLINNRRATDIDCAAFNSIFTSGRITKFHFHIEIKDGVFKYVVSDANNSEATMTFTDTATTTFKYYYQCFTFSKGGKVSITNYKVSSL